MVLRPHEPDPIYNGKPMSFWINSLYSGPAILFKDYDPNLTPVLLKAMQTRDAPLQKAYHIVWPRLPAWAKRFLPTPRYAAQVRVNAILIVRMYAGHSTPALPTLIHLMQEDKDPLVRATSASTLGVCFSNDIFTKYQLPTVIPALLKSLKDKDPQVRREATNAFIVIDREAAAKAGIDVQNPGPLRIRVSDARSQIRQGVNTNAPNK
ncbi:MAG: domain containing protein [Pedosphaera sp.]|nr:domain containing protein [Pedosphaera sp.]